MTPRRRRLRGRSPAELWERAAQATARLLERSGLRDSGEPPAAAMQAHLVRDAGADPWRVPRVLLPSLADRTATVATLRALWPDIDERLRRQADAVLAGRFDLLGFRDLALGHPPDWWHDPLRDVRAPDAHWSTIAYLDPAIVGDHKLVWELGRHRHVVTLAQAFWVTGDARYAEACVQSLVSWMDANPPKRGLHWASSLELALRALAWLWTLMLMGTHLPQEVRSRMLAVLQVSGRHIERYLSTYFSPNTHLTGEALGLFYLGTLLPQLQDAARWRRRGADILVRCIPRHVQPDGVYVEQSTWYHRYTIDIYLHFVLLARGAGWAVPQSVTRALEAMLEHLMYVARPDGHIPLIGDDDGGRLLFLDERTAHDARTPLAVGAVLFGRRDFAYVADPPSPELAWLLGSDGVHEWRALSPTAPAAASRAFVSGGFYVLRDHWGEDGSVAVVDAGPHGFLNAGHAHADALAIDLTVRGHPVFVDPGTYTYTLSAEWRDHFRSGAAHNAVTVDGQPSAVPLGAFGWASTAHGQCEAWYTSPRAVLFRGSHDGFARLSTPVRYTRTVLFLPPDLWIVHDEIAGAGEHELVAHWQCALGIQATPQHDAIELERDGRAVLSLRAFPASRVSIGDGWVSPAYGVRENAPRLTVARRAAGRVALTCLLYAGEAHALHTERSKTGDAHAIMVRAGGRRGLFTGGRVSQGAVESDASIAWLEYTPSGTPHWVVAASATALAVNGTPVFARAPRSTVALFEYRGASWEDATAPDATGTIASAAGSGGGRG